MRLRALLTNLLCASALAGILPATAVFAAPVFTVMNTSETPPDGVYFRSTPHTADAIRITGFGVYMGERVQANCWIWGDPVGRFNNHIWYDAINVTRPTVAGKQNHGYLNTHYVNDGMSADHAAPGVPQCGITSIITTGPPPPPTPGGSLYYSPFAVWSPNALVTGSPATKTLYTNQWAPGNCDITNAGSFPTVVNGRSISTLSGWSLGRMGPIFFLIGNRNRWSEINYIVILDPGTTAELKGDCYSSAISPVFKQWLDHDPTHNRLVIIAGAVTMDWANRASNSQAYQGLRQVYFPAIHGTSAASQVMVCDYANMSHTGVWNNFQGLMNQAPITSCPTAPDHTPPSSAAWHP